jgi:multidrug efflux pump subunit AcrB
MSALFFDNRRLLILAISLILIAGFSSYHLLPRMEDPLMTERFAIVNTLYPGADAERVESLVTDKIEDELREIQEIKEFRSNSRSGVSTVTIELRDDIYEVDSIWSRIRDKLDDAKINFPMGALDPEFDQINVKAYAVIVALKWTYPEEPNYAILRRLTEELEDQIKSIPGTEEIDTFGDPDEEIVVQVNVEKLAALGLSVEDISRQISASDAKVAAGQLRGAKDSLLFEIDSELDSIHRIEQTPILYGSGGKFVTLDHVGKISKGIREPVSSLALIENAPSVVLGVLVQSNYRIDHWNKLVQTKLDEYAGQLPTGVELEVVFEQNEYVAERLSGLLWNLFVGAVSVVSVILLLMGWRNALIVGTALPLAALMVLSGMRFMEIPMHQMSVSGLIIALGLLIDNAIVIVDEVSVRLKEGNEKREAIVKGVKHLAVPLLGSTLTTAFAFAPIALMPGPAGEFVGSIAISVILAIFSSLILALTIIPTLTAMMGVKEETANSSKSVLHLIHSLFERGFHHEGMLKLYRRSLDWLYQAPLRGVALGLILPIAGFIVSAQLAEQFFPPADRDQVQIELELPASASIKETLATAKKIREIATQYPEVEKVHWFIGQSAPTFYYNVVQRKMHTANYGQALVQLTSDEGGKELIHKLQTEMDQLIPSARVLVRQLEQGPPFDAPIELQIIGSDLDELRDIGNEVRSILAQTPSVIHVSAELNEVSPKLSLQVDEQEARLAGLTNIELARQLENTLEGQLGGSILEDTENIPVRIRTTDEKRANLSEIVSLDLKTSSVKQQGHQGVPLSAIADVNLKADVPSIPRLNGRRMNEIKAYVPAGVLPAKVLADFEQQLEESGYQFPAGYELTYGGESAKRNEAVGNLMANVSLLMVMMIATLVLSFKSFRIAVLIGIVAVLSIGLGRGALWIAGYPFGFMAILGTMGLVGIAINDAIVVIAAIKDDKDASQGNRKAVREVVIRSTRHVVATSLTTMAGFFPLIMGGGGFWPPLAVAIAGGVGGATLLALYFIPSAYLLVMCKEKSEGSETTLEPLPWNPIHPKIHSKNIPAVT